MSDIDPQGYRQWSAVAPAWDAARDRIFEGSRAVSERLVERLAPAAGDTVLELTAGPGETGFLVAPLLGGDGRLISSDFVPAMVDAARRGAEARGLDNVEFRILDAQQIDLPDHSVDGVVSRYGLMLVPQQERAVGEIRRVLRPGGRCAYATWAPPDRNPWLFQVVAALMQTGHAPGASDPFAPGGVFSLASEERNRELVASAGFTEVDVEELTGAMTFDDPDDYWSFSTSLAGPITEVVASLDADQVAGIREVLDPSLAPFEADGGLSLPWTTLVTTAA